MIVLDTNVISDSYRERPAPSVMEWMAAQRSADLYLCAPVLAELRYCAERLPAGGRRKRLDTWIFKMENEGFAGRILSFDQGAAHEFGRLFHQRQSSGRMIGIMDAMIAAVARSNGATLATRDIHDFADLDLPLINPFEFKVA